MSHYLIAGCGYLGTRLAVGLLKDGHDVTGICRSRESETRLSQAGIRPLRVDLTQFESLKSLPACDFAVASQAPAPNEPYSQIYLQATQNLLRVMSNHAPRKFIMISSTSVYGEKDGEWVDENTKPTLEGPTSCAPGGNVAEKRRLLLQTEETVLQSSIPSMVLRLTGIYGPGRNRLKRLKEGSYEPAWSEDYTNRIHVDDAAAAIRLLWERGKAGEVYLGTDDEPVKEMEFYTWLYGRLGLAVPMDRSAVKAGARSSKRCSNKKLRSLGFAPQYPTYREGYGALLK